MSHTSQVGYQFVDGLPIDPIPPGSTVLVAGPALSGTEDLVRSMITDSTEFDEGGLFISTNMTCTKLLNACHQYRASLDTSRMGVVDCSGQESGQLTGDLTVKYISTQGDLTGISMKFSALYESLYDSGKNGRIRTGLISLSSLLMYVELRKVFQFAQTLAGRIDTTGGLGVFAIDPTTHDTQTLNTFSQVTDGRIEVRAADSADADGELRIRGLPNQPSGWQPFFL